MQNICDWSLHKMYISSAELGRSHAAQVPWWTLRPLFHGSFRHSVMNKCSLFSAQAHPCPKPSPTPTLLSAIWLLSFGSTLSWALDLPFRPMSGNRLGCPNAPANIPWTGGRLAEFPNHSELWPLNWLPINSSFLPVLSGPAAHKQSLSVTVREDRWRLQRSGMILINLFAFVKFPSRFQSLLKI